MFFKATVLKRMLKAAYKGAGLTVGHAAESDTGEPEGYYISSGWWVMWFNAAAMPKEAKAALIELCGDLPGAGEVFRATKDMGNQYEIEQKEIYNLPAAFKNCKCQFRVTNLLGQQGDKLIRFIQEEGPTQHVTAISEIFIDLIDPQAINYDGGNMNRSARLRLARRRLSCIGETILVILWQESGQRIRKAKKRTSGSIWKE